MGQSRPGCIRVHASPSVVNSKFKTKNSKLSEPRLRPAVSPTRHVILSPRLRVFVPPCHPQLSQGIVRWTWRNVSPLEARLDQGPKIAHFWTVSYLLTSDLKQRTGKILDAAARNPQFVMRDGALFVIAKVDADAALLAAAEQATGLKVSRPGLTDAERNHRNAILRRLDDAEGW